ncbi:hypothetical protein AB6E04_21600, partial [Vibrio amylolyticus]|uniref:hypothetical protein n=1 Tax=Vibrio amylolyticus TaxID=2847292 RepID=UPI0035516321
PIVPTFTCGFVRSNFSLDTIVFLPSYDSSRTELPETRQNLLFYAPTFVSAIFGRIDLPKKKKKYALFF